MKNCDFLLGAALGAIVVGAVVGCGIKKCGGSGGNPPPECEYPPIIAPPCGFCPCCPPERCKKPKKKDPCKGCYYEKYERKTCR